MGFIVSSGTISAFSETSAVDEHFTDDACQALALASQEARRLHHQSIRTEHILLGLIQEGDVAVKVLQVLAVDPAKVCQGVEVMAQAAVAEETTGKPTLSRLAKSTIKAARTEARDLNVYEVGTEHLLLGLLHEQRGVAAKVLKALGLELGDVREQVHDLFSSTRPEAPALSEAELRNLPEGVRQALEELGSQIEQLNQEKETLVGQQDFEKAVQVRDQARKLNRERRAVIRQGHIGSEQVSRSS
jgi:ATP-dependent Clp protease ATP-binding subunit ClpC